MNREGKKQLEFDLAASPDDMMKLINDLSLPMLKELNEAMNDITTRAKIAIVLIRLRAIKLIVTDAPSDGETLQ